MKKFLNLSLQIKEEVKNSPEILQAIRECFKKEDEPYLHGTKHAVHRIGKTASGMHLMLRKKMWSGTFADEIDSFNIYCQNAETMAVLQERDEFDYPHLTPAFCIGVKCGDMAGLITEDMSQGGKYEIKDGSTGYDADRLLNGEKVDEILVDLEDSDEVFNFKEDVLSTTEFFSDENILNV